MRRNLIVAFAVLLSLAGFAQKPPKINQANTSREKGDLATAKDIIDQAIVHEKTKDNGKTWYYRGLIYATLDTTSNPQYAGMKAGALQEAMAAFKKADEIDPEGKNYYTTGEMGLPILKEQQVGGYYGYYYNIAVEAFQTEKYPEAVAAFESSYTIMPSDTNSYINAAYAAHSGELYEQAVKNYKLSIENGAESKDLYNNYVSILAYSLDKKEEALNVVNEALKKFPNDGVLQKTRINLFIQLDRIKDAKEDLLAAIAAEPGNATLYFTLGVLNEEIKDLPAAVDAYKKAIEIDPNQYESNFNYGVLLINEANDVIKESNSLGLSKADMKKAEQLEPVIKDKLRAAMPQWERVYEIKPTDKTAIETLAYIYTQLRINDKAKKMNDILDKM